MNDARTEQTPFDQEEKGADTARESEELIDIMSEEALAEDEDEISPAVEAIIAERDELQDRLLRALADVENSRKRAERERREAAQYGGSKLARDLLPVYDNLNRALATVDEQQREVAKGLIEGIELTLREILNAFEKHDIRPVTPTEGDPFDPQLHQAMFEAPVQGVDEGKVIQVMTEGFTIGERLLRPAQVGVSAKAPKE